MRGPARRSMLVPVLAVVLALALTAGCSGSESPDAGPRPSTSAAPVDTFTALAPPADTSIGSLDPILTRRAYEKARGLLALSLGEAGTLTGSGTDVLVEQLQVPDKDLSVTALLTPQPRAKGLGVRPLFAETVALDEQPVEVVRSTYRGEEVRGLGGESGIRISWSGSVRYRVEVDGRAQEVAYALRLAYVFGPVPEEVGGLRLVQVVPGAYHAAPVVRSCLDEGVLLPRSGTPTASDYGPGPWTTEAGGPACPV